MMLLSLCVFAAVGYAALATDLRDYEYNEVVNKFYSVHHEPSEWRTARDICRQEGASLPTLPSIKHRILLNYVQYTNFNNTLPFEFHLWLATEGHGGGVYLATNGSVLSADISLKLPFVCVSHDGAECNTAETGYEPGPNGVSCYKFHEAPPNPINWLGASAECQAEDAHLAIPDNDSELEYIDAATKSKRGKYWLAIGVHNFKADGVYRTLDGKVFQKSVNEQGGLCVYITERSLLYTYHCESGHASYLCEKDTLPGRRSKGTNV